MISALPSALEPAFKFRAEGEEENAVYAHPRGLSVDAQRKYLPLTNI